MDQATVTGTSSRRDSTSATTASAPSRTSTGPATETVVRPPSTLWPPSGPTAAWNTGLLRPSKSSLASSDSNETAPERVGRDRDAVRIRVLRLHEVRDLELRDTSESAQRQGLGARKKHGAGAGAGPELRLPYPVADAQRQADGPAAPQPREPHAEADLLARPVGVPRRRVRDRLDAQDAVRGVGPERGGGRSLTAPGPIPRTR